MTLRPPKAPVPSNEFEEEYPSGVHNVTRFSVLWMMRDDDGARTMSTAAQRLGLVLEPVKGMQDVADKEYVRMTVVDASMPLSDTIIRRLSGEPQQSLVLAIVHDRQAETQALASGAFASIRYPVSLELAELHLERMMRRTIQEELRAEHDERQVVADRVATIGRIAAAMGHEISNPLSVALSTAQILKESLVDPKRATSVDDDTREVLTDMIESIERMHRIVREVNLLSRGETLTLVPTRLLDVVHDSILHLSNPIRIPIDVKVTSDETALAQADVLERVMSNLLDNALYAVRAVQNPRVTVHVYRTASESRISVRDNGAGVPSGIQDRIFDPFFTTKKGTASGIGLAVCREFLSRMGGALSLAPGEGGACLRIRLKPAHPV